MTKFADKIKQVMGVILDQCGATVEYTEFGADPLEILGDWKPEQYLPTYEITVEQNLEVGVLSVNATDVPNVSLKDKVAFGGKTYAVVDLKKYQGITDLQLESREHLRTIRDVRRINR